jgi:hypothetical protein
MGWVWVQVLGPMGRLVLDWLNPTQKPEPNLA